MWFDLTFSRKSIVNLFAIFNRLEIFFPFSSPLRMNFRHHSLHAHRSFAQSFANTIYDKNKKISVCVCLCVCVFVNETYFHIESKHWMIWRNETKPWWWPIFWVVWFWCSSYCSMRFFIFTRHCIAGMFSNTLCCTNWNGSSIVNSLFELRNWHAKRTKWNRGKESEKKTEW